MAFDLFNSYKMLICKTLGFGRTIDTLVTGMDPSGDIASSFAPFGRSGRERLEKR